MLMIDTWEPQTHQTPHASPSTAENALKGASKIELRNPQRGQYFRIVSKVWIDGESLAEMLKAKGLAKDYDGKGARPELWNFGFG